MDVNVRASEGRRRRPLRLLVGALATLGAVVAVVPSTVSADAQRPPVVKVDGGRLSGSVVGDVARFLGVPYAAPPVGDLRWQPPRPPASWSGVRDATSFGAQCAQASGGSEDCLYLNVYAPAKPHGKVPVMLWIHGGSYVSGTGASYDPTPIVEGGDVIVVTINYRLGLLGALATPGLDAEAGDVGSGAYSLLDQQAALRWVQANIRRFGGDPDAVTIFGESAGATYTCLQLVSPSAAGLFSNVISESGCGLPTTPIEDARAFGAAVAAQVGCIDAAGGEDLACLRLRSPQEINTAAVVVGGSASAFQLASIPAVGGGVLPLSVPDALASGEFNRVPVLLGSNLDEGRLFVVLRAYGPIPTTPEEHLDMLEQQITATFGVPAELVAAEYPFDPSNPAEALSAATGDISFSCRTIAMADLAVAHVPVYLYEFSDQRAPNLLPLPFPLGATHGSELQYLFRQPTTALLDADQRALSASMIGYWTNFAARGQPSRDRRPEPGISPWPSYGTSTALRNLAPTGAGAPPLLGNAAFRDDHHCQFWADALS
ncbi:MAG: carboxylesterase family protein [Ilumatobacteraceae bacterium]